MIAFLPLPALASSPGMVESPPGCTWNATVTEAAPANAAVELDTVRGTCMAQPGPCGNAGDIFVVPVYDSTLGITAGETVQVWVDKGPDGELRASFTRPQCIKTPISP